MNAISLPQAKPELSELATLQHPLSTMFTPGAIAVIGATERPGSVGRTVLENLLAGHLPCPVYPVNPSRTEVLGLRAYQNIAAVPEKIDLAVIVTPAPTVPGLIAECAAAGVAGSVVISAGFKECGAEGLALESQIETKRGAMRVIGPNCLGLMVPQIGLNATFAKTMAKPGSVGFISQSGAMCTAILDWSLANDVGFSAFVSIGSMADVDWGDLIYYLGNDAATKSVVIYMETIGNARSFLSAAREVALQKPIIVIKVGRSSAAAKAAASHTGSLTGSDEVLDAAFRRVGVLRVETIADLFSMADVLGKQPRPAGPRLAIVTNGGGPGALATDMAIAQGGEIADLSPSSLEAFNALLPSHWSHNNPVDILGDAGAGRYGKAVEILSADPGNDGILAILTPQAMTECSATAEHLAEFAPLAQKPILASWMGGEIVAEGAKILREAGVPTFAYPDTAARAFCLMWRYSRNLRSLYETPALTEPDGPQNSRFASTRKILAGAVRQRRSLLTEYESKQILNTYDIPAVDSLVAYSPSLAVSIADSIGFPVALKLHSESITHKSDVGGVKLNLRNALDVAKAFESIRSSVEKIAGPGHFLGVTVQPMVERRGIELILGSSVDPQFGPVLLFGAGGQLVEVFKDRTLGLPPLNATLARRMVERTRVSAALRGVRGEKGIDMAALERILVRFSQLVAEQPRIKEIDINPLLVSAEQILALDARIILHDPAIQDEELPALAIRPYPSQYISAWQLAGGEGVKIRPIRPEDEPLLVKFHATLSEETVQRRYLMALGLAQRTSHDRLARICFNDYDREIALVVERPVKNGTPEIIAVARMSKIPGSKAAEIALLVGDPYQGMGLGTHLLNLLANIARQEKIGRLVGYLHPENLAMRRVAEKTGCQIATEAGENHLTARLDLP